ncbi:FtsK/SpoIIIE domain-containing protein, partial [Staphylococcus epidermidis]|uniref:FtsK/SpoIIIE domain-containing protein n=1 Tax=Staphylococcus epidermidis TaxID=1282 RepID=UPI0016435A7F
GLLMDIAKRADAVMGGARGSGKWVCMNSMLMCLVYKNDGEELGLLVIDGKMVEVGGYKHLGDVVRGVITDVTGGRQS